MLVYAKNLKVSPPLFIKDDSAEGNTQVTVQKLKTTPNNLNHLIHFYHNNQGREVSLVSNYEKKIYSPSQMWGFRIKDIVFFWWESGSNILYYCEEAFATSELITYWLLHVTLPMFFTVEEKYAFIHAGAVEVQGNPILFLAESFGGKSTMTDFFIQQGHRMVSDDKVGTFEEKGVFFSVPSYPYHRPYRKIEDMGIYVENFASEPKPIHAFYVLKQVDKDANIEIDEIIGIEKFYLLRLSSQFNLSFQKKERFEYLSRMSNSARVFRIKVPWDLDRLPEVYNEILKHVEII